MIVAPNNAYIMICVTAIYLTFFSSLISYCILDKKPQTILYSFKPIQPWVFRMIGPNYTSANGSEDDIVKSFKATEVRFNS